MNFNQKSKAILTLVSIGLIALLGQSCKPEEEDSTKDLINIFSLTQLQNQTSSSSNTGLECEAKKPYKYYYYSDSPIIGDTSKEDVDVYASNDGECWGRLGKLELGNNFPNPTVLYAFQFQKKFYIMMDSSNAEELKIYSSTDGENFSAMDISSLGTYINRGNVKNIFYTSNSVILGFGRAVYTFDGTNFTKTADSNTPDLVYEKNSTIYRGMNGACLGSTSYNGSNSYLHVRSTDGTTWTTTAHPSGCSLSTNQSYYSFYADGKVIAVKSGTGELWHSSDDGANFTTKGESFSGTTHNGFTGNFFTAFGKYYLIGVQIFANSTPNTRCGTSGNCKLFTSSDGISWTEETRVKIEDTIDGLDGGYPFNVGYSYVNGILFTDKKKYSKDGAEFKDMKGLTPRRPRNVLYIEE